MSLTAEKVRDLAEKLALQVTQFPSEFREWQEVRWVSPTPQKVADWFEATLNAALAEADGPAPWAYAIETPGGDMYDGEYAVFGDKHSAQDQVDCLNDDLEESEEQYKLVPLFRGDPSPAAEGRKK
jgi:hypothetical protein